MRIAFWMAIVGLAYAYVGYPLLLKLLLAASRIPRGKRPSHPTPEHLPQVTVIVPVYNEEAVIGRRIRNLLALEYPVRCLQIVVASDGSIDSTVDVCRREFGGRIVVLDFPSNRGRSAVLNDALEYAEGDLVVFTDADTLFEPDFLLRAVDRFEPQVGAVVGRLVYRYAPESSIGVSEGLYWRYEVALRKLESALGILAVGTGACLVARKRLIRSLPANYDIDDALPLDCIQQGYRVVFEPEAVAYDEPPASPRGEIAARMRITSRALAGLLRKWRFRDAVRHPGVTLALVSHRLLRYLSPYLMLLAVFSTVVLAGEGGVYALAGLVELSLCLLSLLGYAVHLLGRSMPIVSPLFSFVVANIGIMGGVVLAVLGRAPSRYRST